MGREISRPFSLAREKPPARAESDNRTSRLKRLSRPRLKGSGSGINLDPEMAPLINTE